VHTEAGTDHPDEQIVLYNLWNTEKLPFPIEVCSSERDWVKAAGSWPYKCLPLKIAAEAGWAILSPVQFLASWNGSNGKDGVTLQFERGRHFNCVQTTFGLGIITFNIPYLFRTPPGINLWVHGPVNWFQDGVQALDGMVETDWSDMKFTMNWKLTRPFHPVRFYEGDPICVITPYPRHFLEGFVPRISPLAAEPDLEQRYRTWAERRRDHVAAKRQGELPAKAWQKDYYLGKDDQGAVTKSHQTRLHLAAFSAMQPSGDNEDLTDEWTPAVLSD
jgi:hypothetical protein